MCGNTVAIQSPTAEIRREKKDRKKEYRKIEITGQKYNGLPYSTGRPKLTNQAAISSHCRQHGISMGVAGEASSIHWTRVRDVDTAREHGCEKMTPVSTAREHGYHFTRPVDTGRPYCVPSLTGGSQFWSKRDIRIAEIIKYQLSQTNPRDALQTCCKQRWT